MTLALFVLSGCSWDEAKRLGMPEGITNHTDRITALWQGGWIAVLAVGVLVWGLILFSVVAFRRKATDEGLPLQIRYNLPIEVIYTVVPLVLISFFFFFTARDEAELIHVSSNVDNTVNVVGKRWSWDFNYVTEDVWESGTPGQPPTLVLPLGESVKFVLTSRDVIHAFWVPAFQFKMDMVPGRINEFQVTPTKKGEFAGRCAELCGVDHSRMLFTLKVVDPDDYDAYIQSLREAGQTGSLPTELGPQGVKPGEGQNPGNILGPGDEPPGSLDIDTTEHGATS